MPEPTRSFPSEDVKDRIHQLPKFTADISMFTAEVGLGDSSGVFLWAINYWSEHGEKDIKIVLNISNASKQERIKFEEARNKLKFSAFAIDLELFDEKQEVGEITREITTQVVDDAIDAFRKFIAKVLDDQPELLIAEYNTYAAPRGKTYDEVHYWENLGLAAQNDPLREEVTKDFLDRVIAENESELTEKVGKYLSDTAVITDTREKIGVLMLGMLSNMVRGLFYKEASPDKVYGPNVYKLRRLAVDAVDEWMQTKLSMS